MKVLLHYSAGPAWRQSLSRLEEQGLSVDCCDELDDERFHALLPQAEVLWHVLRPVSAEDIGRATALRLIQKIGVGVNTIDLAAARERKIAVCNMPNTNTRAVAEMTLLLMLACLRRLSTLDRQTRGGNGWHLDPRLQDNLHELAGRTVGLVGFGAVPRLLAPMLQALGAKVIYTATREKADIGFRFVGLETLLSESDIVSLHVPLTEQTAGLIGKDRIASMKPGSIFVNTARGGLTDQAALVAALGSGHIRAAGLDVFAVEPLAANDPIMGLDNVVLTPHLAWLTEETLSRSLNVAIENCRRIRAGEKLLHQVI